jgi:hypothetical protein
MHKFILVALSVFFSINVVSSAAVDEIFEIEAEGSYRMESGSSVKLAKKWRFSLQKEKLWNRPANTFHEKALSRLMN